MAAEDDGTMASAEMLGPIREQIFSMADGYSCYAVLDGASAERLSQTIYQHAVKSVCLLRGELIPDLARAAPYLVRLETGSPFTDWLLNEGWGRHWGIFVISGADLRTLRQHFRSVLTVYGPDSTPLFFRYYDPRVLRVYLPTCSAEELVTVFGPVRRYLMESEDGQGVLGFELRDGALVCR